MRIVPFRPEHVDEIQLGGVERTALGAIGDVTDLLAKSVRSGTFMDGDTPLGAYGLVVDANGAGWFWMLLSDAWRKHPVALHRGVKRELGRIAAQGLANPLYGAVRADYATGHRWLEKLGFTADGVVSLPHGEFTRFVKWA